MKKSSLIQLYLFFLTCSLQLQLKSADNHIAYDVKDHKTVSHKSVAPNFFTNIPRDTCLDKKFSVVFYIILDSIHSMPNTTPASVTAYINAIPLATAINIMNTAFSRLCVSFEHCKTVTISNYSYNKWKTGVIDSIVTANWYSEKTLNIYLPSKVISTLPFDNVSYSAPLSSGTVTTKDFIVVQQNMLISLNNASFAGSHLLHALGHFFGLPHTYAEVSASLADGPSTELVNGSNSTTNGDGFDDTDADCFPTNFNASVMPVPICTYEYKTGTLDANGKYYSPPIDNFMSLYECRCRFSQRQYNAMAKTILTKRLYLH